MRCHKGVFSPARKTNTKPLFKIGSPVLQMITTKNKMINYRTPIDVIHYFHLSLQSKTKTQSMISRTILPITLNGGISHRTSSLILSFDKYGKIFNRHSRRLHFIDRSILILKSNCNATSQHQIIRRGSRLTHSLMKKCPIPLRTCG